MTKKELLDTLWEIDGFIEEHIDKADEYAHRRLPAIPKFVYPYNDSKYWGLMASYIVAVARKEGIIHA